MEIIQEKLLEQYGPASVAIDQNCEIIYHNGPTNRYLLQPRGVPTQNLLELLPESLRSRIRGALYRSGREERPVAVRTSVAGDDNRTRLVSLRITKAAENIYLVVFQEKGARSKEAAAEQVDSAVIEETAIHQLETELSATRVHLQSYIEQLKSLNEELQSSNEELQAANEELETSREELQSLNEELITVNSQLQGKIEEQDETNNDLNNFLASTNIPTIFLDTHFRVKRFTPAMLKLIKLLPSDIGRPIVDMSQENLGPDLTSDAQAILEQLAPLRRELEIGSAWYVRTSLPYRTADNRIEGVVITYNDVTELKRAEERSRHLASFPQLNPNPVIEVDASGNVIFANPGTERMLESLGRGKGDVNVFLPEDLDAILKDLQKNSEFSVTREVAVKDRVFGETIQLVPQFNVVRIYTYDITERKKAEEIQGRLSAIVASAEDAIISKDLNGVIQTWNVGAEKIFGYTTEEVIGRNISLLIPPDHADEVPAILKRLTQGEHIENYETVRMRKDGTIVPVSLNFSAIRDSGGKVIGASKIAHDITERKLAEESLRESEEKFRGLFTWMGEAVQLCELVLDEGGGPIDVIIIDVNPAYEKETGLSRDKVVGRRIKEVLPVVEQVWLDRYGEIVRTGTPMHFEEYNASVDRWFNVYASPMKGNRFAVVFSDVTERKRAEEALRENEKQFRSLADSIPNLAWWANADGYITWYNRRWYEYTGTTPEQMEGWGWQSVHDPNVLPKVLERWQASITTGEPFGMEFPLRGSDGIFRSFLTRVMPLKDSEGKVLRWFGTNTDISALKQAEEVQGRLAAIVENAEDAIVGKDLNGIIQSWNVGAEKIFGYTAEEAIGKNVSILTPPGHTEDVPEILARINQGEHIESFETLRMRKDGTIIPVSLKFSAIKDASGKVIGASKIAHDISARKRAEEALRESDERVRRKLDSILSPEGDIGDLDLSDIIDAGAIQALIDDFYKLAHMPMSIIDLKGKMLVGAGWQQICTEFHRTHPETCRNCVESDLQLSAGVLPGAYKLYKCNNNMWDVATPIIVGGKHMGNLFMGQFFFEDEPLDYESFRAQARRYGFDEKQYIAALETVPRLSRDSLNTSMAFFMKLADILSKSSYGNLKLARSLAQRDALTGSLRESEDRLKRAQEISHVGSWELDLVNNRLTWSDEVYRIFGLQPQEFGATYEAFLEAVHPDDRAAVDAAYSGSIREGKDTYEIEHRVVRKDAGEIRYVHEKCQHFRDETGRIIRSIGMVHDVTERKQAEEEIKQHIGELQAANEELARFNRAAVDRELRMIELKKEVNGLLKRAGQPPRFPLDFEKES
jgi:PAS domain S-box-containing protein